MVFDNSSCISLTLIPTGSLDGVLSMISLSLTMYNDITVDAKSAACSESLSSSSYGSFTRHTTELINGHDQYHSWWWL
jgi:hypothetical protein